MNFSNFNSRKLITASILFVVSTIFVIVDKAIFTDWTEFMKWVFAIYAAGNVGEHFANNKE